MKQDDYTYDEWNEPTTIVSWRDAHNRKRITTLFGPYDGNSSYIGITSGTKEVVIGALILGVLLGLLLAL